jgi:predicted TIM-barrel fold metal-dependent hydrolase
MEIKYGLVSADSHVVLDRDAFTKRMSATKWGDKIPQVAEVEDRGKQVERWVVYGKQVGLEGSGVCNCPAVMGDPFPTYPSRWEQVPPTAFDPLERLKALDHDGVDAEVLFPNNPGQNFVGTGDPAFELEAAAAYNDALAEWAQASDRYLPLAMVPYLSEPQAIVREIERAVEAGHRGVNVMGKMPETLPHLADPHWAPLWDVCQSLDVPAHFHGSAGINIGANLAKWDGYTQRQRHSASTTPSAVTPGQIIPHLIFSGVTERFPDLKCVFAEAGIGGLNYVIAACDHEWETRHLWTEGIATRPSETVRRQMYVNFWFEAAGIQLRHHIGIDNLMWESDFPHVASFYPKSREHAERVVGGLPEEDRRKLLWENACRVYKINATESPLPLGEG